MAEHDLLITDEMLGVPDQMPEPGGDWAPMVNTNVPILNGIPGFENVEVIDTEPPVETALSSEDPKDIPAVDDPVAPPVPEPGDTSAVQGDEPPDFTSASTPSDQLISAVGEATAEAQASSSASVQVNLDTAPATAGLPVVEHPEEAKEVARSEGVSVDSVLNYSKFHQIDFHDYKGHMHRAYDKLVDEQQEALDKLCDMAVNAFEDMVDGEGKGMHAARADFRADIKAFTKTANEFAQLDDAVQDVIKPGGNHYREQKELWKEFKDVVEVEKHDLSLAAGQDHADFDGLYQDFAAINQIVVNDFLLA